MKFRYFLLIAGILIALTIGGVYLFSPSYSIKILEPISVPGIMVA